MRLFIIGGGKMGQAITVGLLQENILSPQDIHIIDPHIDKTEVPQDITLHSQLQAGAVSQEDVVILAVKPQVMAEVLSSLPEDISQSLVVSIAAGISIDGIVSGLGEARVARVMPNTPAAIGLGMSVYCMNDACGKAERAVIERLFSAVGLVYEISDEDLMHGVTALSGSGPAYVFHFMEALMEAGRGLGLPEDLLRLSVVQILRGSVALAGEGKNLEELRRNVTSPGGTTEAALGELMGQEGGGGGLGELLKRTLAAAERRSKELQ